MTKTCGTCGDPTIHIRAESMRILVNGHQLDVAVWMIRCGNGHVWVPALGQEYELRIAEVAK